MIILAIETSTPNGSVALLNSNETIGELLTDNTETHAATLLPTINKLFASTKRELNSINGIAVSIGPGAFTGLRVGISTAQGLAQTLKLPIYPVPTLEAFAYSALPTTNPIFVTLDARKDEIYGALFRWNNNELVRLIPEKVLSPEQWCKLLNEFCKKETISIGGPGYLRFQKIFRNHLNENIIEITEQLTIPKAVNVGLVAIRHAANRQCKTPAEIKPIYLRQP